LSSLLSAEKVADTKQEIREALELEGIVVNEVIAPRESCWTVSVSFGDQEYLGRLDHPDWRSSIRTFVADHHYRVGQFAL
jgi:hypothetical protein